MTDKLTSSSGKGWSASTSCTTSVYWLMLLNTSFQILTYSFPKPSLHPAAISLLVSFWAKHYAVKYTYLSECSTNPPVNELIVRYLICCTISCCRTIISVPHISPSTFHSNHLHSFMWLLVNRSYLYCKYYYWSDQYLYDFIFVFLKTSHNPNSDKIIPALNQINVTFRLNTYFVNYTE